ncbi:MAG: hypothetical protein LUG93_17105 [Lachnospiraceae bacterium]|nr:hypothetical protein [Lachnospiraceae bacterium]
MSNNKKNPVTPKIPPQSPTDTEKSGAHDAGTKTEAQQDPKSMAEIAAAQSETGIVNPHVDTRTAKRTGKDSVFTNMFQQRKYLLQLYQALHPEDTSATEDSLTNITIENVLVNGQYNDVGFLVNDKLVILVEEQSSNWTMNIIVRALFYIDHTLQIYLGEREADLYGSKKVYLPETELYVLYTGDRVDRPDKITLREQFYTEPKERRTAIDVTVKMLYGTVHPEKIKGEDIIGQYVSFTKEYNKQVKEHGRTAKAVSETIRICMEQNILREYLGSRKKEVVTMMMDLYDQDRILEIHIASEKKIAAEEARNEGIKEGIKEANREAEKEKTAAIMRMLKLGKLTIEEIAACQSVSAQSVREIEAGMLQEA